MKNPFSVLSRANIEASFGVLRRRFPLPSLLIVVLAGVLFYSINAENDSVIILRIILTCITTFFLSVGMSLFLEVKTEKHLSFLHIIPLVYGVTFYLTTTPLTNDWMIDSVTYFILHLVGFVALLFFAPYCRGILYRKDRTIEYTNYFTRTAWTLLMSDIVGFALVALGFVAISSVVALFDLTSLIQDYKIYENWAIFSLALVAPLYCLIHLPKTEEMNKNSYEINRFFSFLIRYLAIPFIVIYFIILYAYSAKVLLNFGDWPKGIISWMVVGFSTFGYLIYIFSKPYEKESSVVAIVRLIFPYAVPAQILMLGYAIYLRIAQYDLTMNRYFVVLFGLWLAFISTYYILSKRKSLTVVTVSLSALALLVSVGPWSVYQLPLTRQYTRLITNLETAGMLVDGVISKKSAPISAELENNIYSGIQYVCGYDNCQKIKSLFNKELENKEAEYTKKWNAETYNAGKKYPGMNQWEVVNEVTTALDISYRYEGMDTKNQKFISLGTSNKFPDGIFPINIGGYESIIRVHASDYAGLQSKDYISISAETEKLTLRLGGEEIGTVSLQTFNESLRQKYTQDTWDVSPSDLSHTLSLGDREIRLIFENYSFKNKNYATEETTGGYAGISGYALIKKK